MEGKWLEAGQIYDLQWLKDAQLSSISFQKFQKKKKGKRITIYTKKERKRFTTTIYKWKKNKNKESIYYTLSELQTNEMNFE